MTIQIPLTPAQTSSIIAQDTLAAGQIAGAAKATLTPDQFVFFAAFDGTNNDLVNKGNATSTNVAALYNQLLASDGNNPNFGIRYYAGLGTKGTLTGSSWFPGQVTAQANITADRAYNDFCDKAIAWLKEDPAHHQASAITAALTSFSRGDAAAAIFSQLLYEKGLVDPDGKILIAPGQIAVTAGVIFDPVTTGYSGNLAFAPNATNIVDVRAMNDYRYSFEATSYAPQSSSVTTVNMIGNHADIGGSYDHGIAALSLQGATAFFILSGIKNFGTVLPSRVFDSKQVVVHSEGDNVIFPTYRSFIDSPTDLDPATRSDNSSQVVAPATTQTIGGSTGKVMTLFNGDILKISTPGGSGTERVEVDSLKPDPNVANRYLAVEKITDYSGLNDSGSVIQRTNSITDIPDFYYQVDQITDTVYTQNSDTHEVDITLRDSTTTLSVHGENGVNVGVDIFNIKVFDTSDNLLVALGNAKTATGKFTWEDGNGEQYLFAPGASGGAAGQIGTLTVSNGQLGSNQIIINDFNLNAAQTSNGYLGITLGSEQLALETGSTRNSDPFLTGNFSPDNVGKLVKGAIQTFTVYASEVKDQAQQVVVTAASSLLSSLGINLGDGYIPFSDGSITLTIPAGQDSVTIALVNSGDGTEDVTAKITATLQGQNDSTSGPTSNELDINFGAQNSSNSAATSTPVTADKVITGDQNPKKFYVDDNNYTYRTDSLGNTITDGTPDPGRTDYLNGSAGNDRIDAGDGNNFVNAIQGGDDAIYAGSGDDTIYAGTGNDTIDAGGGANMVYATSDGNDVIKTGDGKDEIHAGKGNDSITAGDGDNLILAEHGGNDTIKGGKDNDTITGGDGNNIIAGNGGQDVILVGDGDNTIYADAKVDLSDAISDNGSVPKSDEKGSIIGVGDGDNTIIGGAGNDAIMVGGGNNLVILGSGNDHFVGGITATQLGSDWTVSPQSGVMTWDAVGVHLSNAFDVPAGLSELEYNQWVGLGPSGTGDDTIFGGSGDSWIYTSNGNNYVDAGTGNSSVYAGAGDDTIFGGNGNGDLTGGGGNDYIDAEGGNHYIAGGQGDNTIYGGSGNDVIFAGDDTENWYSAQTGNNYVDGGSGNSQIYGSGGNDTLIAGSGDSTIYGGSGNEYIEGGSGNSELHGHIGAGPNANDTLVAGDGNTTIYGGAGNDVIYGGTGIDFIHGGDGTAEIHSGDGGTIDAATRITVGAGNTTVYGGSGYLQVTGGSGNDTLIAGDGDTTLTGGSGTELLYAGTGNDLLMGGSGSDTLYGGFGSATLQGGSGATTFQIDADAGDVLIIPSGPFNTLVFGTGISITDLEVTGSLGANGNPVFEIDLPNGGVVSIQGGLDGALNQFSFADSAQTYDFHGLLQAANSYSNDIAGPHGDLVYSFANGDVLSGTVSGNDTLESFGADSTLVGGYGNETFVIHDRSDVVQAQATGLNTIQTTVSITNSVNVQNLVGTGNNDLMLVAANGFDQTITANDGNDTLVGAHGNDTLVGGAGLDTFVLGADTGSATAIQNSLRGGIVQLAPGLGLGQLSATRMSDDLLLRVDGSDASMRLQGYFASNAPAWTIEDSAGRAVTPLDLISATQGQASAKASQLWDVFSAQVKTGIAQTYSDEGWARQADGTFAMNFQYPLWGEGDVETMVMQTTSTPLPYGSAMATISQSDPQYWRFNNSYSNGWSSGTESIKEISVQSNDSQIYADPGVQSIQNSQQVWIDVSWSHLSQSQDSWIGMPYTQLWTNSVGQSYVLTDQSFYSEVRTTANGTWGGISHVQSQDAILPNGLPKNVLTTYQSQTDVNEIQEIKLTSGEQTVFANSNTMVVGGDGNSTIYNAGLALLSAGNNYVVNTAIVYGGAGNDTMEGGNTFIGGSGNETMINGATMIAGTGDEQIFTGASDSTIKIGVNSAGVDLVGGEGDSSQFLNVFYTSIGISDWQNSYQYPDMYRLEESGVYTLPELLQVLQGGRYGGITTFEQASASGYLTYYAPLPVLARVANQEIQAGVQYSQLGTPIVEFSANDFQALAPYQAILPTHRLVFGAGISADNLSFSWGTVNSSMSGYVNADSPASTHTTLNISWGTSGVVQVLIPHFDDPIGSGVSEFDFADGTKLSLAAMIAKAPVAPTFDPQLQDYEFQSGGGEQVLGSTFRDVQFSGLKASQITVSRNGSDLILSASDYSNWVCLPGWYSTPYAYSKFVANFADGTQWDANYLTQHGLILDGSQGDQTITGLSGYANTLIAGPNDTLVGGDGNSLNTYVFNANSGTVHIQDSTGSGTIVFGSGITPDQITLGLGSLALHIGTNGDTIHVDNYDPQNARGSSGVYLFKFADGSSLTLDQLLQRGFDIAGTNGDEVLRGTNVSDRIYAGSGNDTLIGGNGDDVLVAGLGFDTFEFSAGDGKDIINELAKSGGASGTDAVVFDSNVSAPDLLFNRNGANVVIAYGASGNSITIENPQAIGNITFADGSYDTYQSTDATTATITNYTADGTAVTVSRQTFDGSGNATTINYGADNVIQGSNVQSSDAQGNTAVTYFDAVGLRLNDTWIHVDGAHGDDTFNADGTYSGNAYQADGSHSHYSNDGHGVQTLWRYDLSGNYLGSSTTTSDGVGTTDTRNFDKNDTLLSETVLHNGGGGAYESKTIFADGTSKGARFDPHGLDGNFAGALSSTYTSDAQGNTQELEYAASGNLLGKAATSIDPQSQFKTTTLFDPAGRKLSDSWSNPTAGSWGTDTFGADGSSSGLKHQLDGTYSSYTSDGLGNATTLTFDADGNAIGDQWARNDGTQGSDAINPGGSKDAQITYTYADGSTYATDTLTQLDGSYQQSWTKSDGSYGSNTLDQPTGEVTGSLHAAGTNYVESWGNTTLAGGATESKVSYAYDDGTYSSSDTVNQADGSYQIQWMQRDGSNGTNTVNPITGESTGSSKTAGDNYTVYWDNTVWANGATEAKTRDVYDDGSSTSSDTLTQLDGSYQQAWATSSGTQGSTEVAGGVVQGDSWMNAGGFQCIETQGKQLLIGSTADDGVYAGSGATMMIGGTGNDLISASTGANIVAFNHGDGHDTVYSVPGAGDTLSLGGNFAYSDLAFEHVGNDLVLDVGAQNSVTLKDWYAYPVYQNFVTLQVVTDAMSDHAPGSGDTLRDASVQTFDFKTLVSEFDAVQSTGTATGPWSLTFGLLDANLSASNDAAMGGELAYDYGKNGTLAGTDVLMAQSTLSASSFGVNTQSIHASGGANGIAKIA